MRKSAGLLPLVFFIAQSVRSTSVTLETGSPPEPATPAPSSMLITVMHILTNVFVVDAYFLRCLGPRTTNVGGKKLILFFLTFGFIFFLRLSDFWHGPLSSSLYWIIVDVLLFVSQLRFELGKLETYLQRFWSLCQRLSSFLQTLNLIFLMLSAKMHLYGHLREQFKPSWAILVLFFDISALIAYVIINFRSLFPKKKHYIRPKYLHRPYTTILGEVQDHRVSVFPDELKNTFRSSLELEDAVDMTDFPSKATDEVHWVVFENMVCELSGLNNSAAVFLFDVMTGRDITAFFYGCSRFYYFDAGKFKVLSIENRPTKMNRKILREHCFGTVANPIFTASDLSNDGKSPERELIGVQGFGLETGSLSLTERPEIPQFKFLTLSVEVLAKFGHSRWAIMLLKRKKASRSKRHLMDLERDPKDLIGKFCLWKPKKDERRVVHPLFFLNSKRFKHKNKLIYECCESLFDYNKRFLTQEMIKISAVSDSAAPENVSEHFPVLFKGQGDNYPVTLEVSDLLGSDFTFLSSSPKRVFFIIKDAGIIPLLEFFDQKLTQTVTAIHRSSTGGRHLNASDLQSVHTGIKATIYWEISPKFGECARTLGLYHLQMLKEVQRRWEQRAPELVREVFLDSDSVDFQLYDHLKKVRLKNKTLLEILKLAHGQYDRIVVLGSDKFKTWLFGTSRTLPEIFAQITVI